MSNPEHSTDGQHVHSEARKLFDNDAARVPALSVDRRAVLAGGRRRQAGRRRTLVLGAAAAAVVVGLTGWAVSSSLGGSVSTAPAGASSAGPPTEAATQPLSGAGWRLLGEGRDEGEAGTTAVATTDDQLEQVWREAGLSGDLPRVDWDTEVVISFGAIWSSGREIRLTELVVQDDTVYPLTPTLEPDLGGDDDARPHSFVLAVERSALPTQVPFFVQLGEEPVGNGWPQERTVVEVDLSAAGSTATDEELHDDPDLTPEIPTTVEDGGSIPVGEEVIFWFTPGECGWERLGTFDGQEWRLAADSAPPADLPPVEGDAWLTRLDEGQILYSIPETELIYVPAEDGWTCAELPHALVMTQMPYWWGSEVLHPGSLVIDDAGCLALHSNVDDRVNGLLLPPGTIVDNVDSTARVTLPTGLALDVGDRVTGSGHYRPADIAYLLPADSPCPTYPAYTGPGQAEEPGQFER